MDSDVSRLLNGKGVFVNDIHRPEMLYLGIVRSPYARARIIRVRGGLSATQFNAVVATVGEGAEPGTSKLAYTAFASEYVNYVGQPVAAVCADSLYSAADLAESVEVEYEPLKPVVDMMTALDSEPIHPGTTSNVAASAKLGSDFQVDSEVILEETFENARVAANPIEPRGIVANYDGGRLTVWLPTQSVHSVRQGICASLNLAPEKVRVIQTDTGGAFGTKGAVYPEYVVACHVAMKERRPVKWIETRLEHLAATHHGRGAAAEMKVYADKGGKVAGVKASVLVDAGAYPAGLNLFAPRYIGFQITGPYAIPRVFVEARGVFTNKVPLGPYRGAGRPEAAFFIERMMDMLADELGLDPVQVRMRNASSEPFVSGTGLRINPFRPFLEDAVKNLGYRNGQGAGFSSFVLVAATQPGEAARIAVADGVLRVWLGATEQGQGHEGFVRSLVSEELGVPGDAVRLEGGDTEALGEGIGSWGSRSTIMGGAALIEACRKLKEQALNKLGKYSAEMLLDGKFDVTCFHSEKNPLNSFGANLVLASVGEDGLVKCEECRAYYDVGRVLDEAMVRGQVMGGTAQGIGQVLQEEVRYDEEGQLVTGSIADAGVPTAESIPGVVVVKLASNPSTLPHGAKGVGESPTIGVPPALVRAIETATAARVTRTPILPEELRAAMVKRKL